MAYLFEGLALIFLLFLSALFSGSETAIFHLPRVKIEKLISLSPSFSIIREREKLLGTILFGNTLVNTGASILAARIFYRTFQTRELAVVTGIMAYIILVFGEFIPKLYSLEHSETVSLKLLPCLRFVRYVFLPITIPVNALISLITPQTKAPITRDELRVIVTTETEEGHLAQMEREFFLSLLNFKDKKVKDIMTDKTKLKSLSANLQLTSAIISELSYSRIPVYDGSPEHVTGILYLKDLIASEPTGGRVNKLPLRPPYFVSVEMSASELLLEFQRKRIHIAIVADDNKSAVGVVTLDDILRTIIGR